MVDAMPASVLLERHAGAWREATDHPFLDGVREGTLFPGAFAAWLVQDYHFAADLLAFQARLLALAPRSPQAVLAGGLVGLEAELTWFEQQARRRTLDLTAPRHPTAEAYRAELERLLKEPFAVAITGLWALELAYLVAWQGAAPGAPDYREFVDHWTTPEFANYVAGLGVHATASAAGEAAWLRIVRLERAFWDMAMESPP